MGCSHHYGHQLQATKYVSITVYEALQAQLVRTEQQVSMAQRKHATAIELERLLRKALGEWDHAIKAGPSTRRVSSLAVRFLLLGGCC